jgi:Flp pilus assembly protein TadD
VRSPAEPKVGKTKAFLYGAAWALGTGLVLGGTLLGLARVVATGEGWPGIRQEPLREAARLLAAGERERAAREYRHATELNPGDYALALSAGVGLTEAGDLSESASALLRAHRMRRDRADPLVALGWALLRSRRLEAAENAFNEGLRLDPRSARAHAGLGEIWLERDRFGEARAAFEASLAVDPRSAEVHNSLGIAFALMGRRAEAIAHFETAVALRPGSAYEANLLRARSEPPSPGAGSPAQGTRTAP